MDFNKNNGIGRGSRAMCAAMFISVFCLLVSCGFLNQAPVTVTVLSPKEELVADAESCVLSLQFSASMNEISTEQAFSLTADGGKIDGRFFWDDRVLTFVPDGGFSSQSVYEVKLSQGAEDVYGNDLYATLHRRFLFRKDLDRPFVAAVSPGNGEKAADNRVPIVITFSEPVNRRSFYEAFTLSPHVSGFFSWSMDDGVCAFTPTEGYVFSADYVLKIASTLTDLSGNAMGEKFLSVFTIGNDDAAPIILEACNTLDTAILIREDPSHEGMSIHEGWERFWDLRITVSKPIPVDGLPRYISLKPETPFDITTGSAASVSQFDIVMKEGFSFNTVYTLTLLKGLPDTCGNGLANDAVYHFRVDGPQSRPPRVNRVEFLEDPDESLPVTVLLSNFGSIHLGRYAPHHGGAVLGFFDIYLTLAKGAAPDVPAFMENFSITTENGCAILKPEAVEWGTYTGIPPAPNAGETCVRLWVDIEDKSSYGLIILKLSSEFKDSLGNRPPGDWVFYLNEATTGL